ncbi:MAG: hydroxymethylbilane synthase [Chloroflexi bacterium]|nr:hydroxymethylbilane synthase [Chloroflexota bacterium]
MVASATVVVGSRGSALALAQTREVITQLAAGFPALSFQLKKITTQGDLMTRTPLPEIGGKGLFVKELEIALQNKEIDLAVHSFKDLPTELTPGMMIGAITRREDARDALVSKSGGTLETLPDGAVVGTSSPRRASQLMVFRPDLEIVNLRGNLDTRLRKVFDGPLDAAVLAAAGLVRLGQKDKISQYVPPEIILPAVGQGALAIEIRENDARMTEIVKTLDDGPTRQAITAERACLGHLGGGCNVPIGVYGRVRGGVLNLQAIVADPHGNHIVRTGLTGDVDMGEGLGHLLARRLLALGADKLLIGEAG